mmetsp:Transcript_38348/g.78220  ORF Transcript_38348/g.78220 Transcript_38348/m.78220 type:complete len:208 (-) Transcript_38348:326-949(-)
MSNASLILPFLPSPLSAAAPTAALFSFQNNPETTAPAARNTILRSNGPVTPRTDAAHEANFPAMMATRASPVKANPNVSPRYSRKFVRPASPLTHASGAVNNSDRAHPTMARPANRTQSSLDLMVATPMEYSSANASVPAFRPYLSVACPIEGPSYNDRIRAWCKMKGRFDRIAISIRTMANGFIKMRTPQIYAYISTHNGGSSEAS